MNLKQTLERMEAAGLRRDHMPTTRQSYQASIRHYARLLKQGVVSDPQTYLDHLATVERLSWSSIKKQHLNALNFFYREVLHKDLGELRLPKARAGRRMPNELTHADCINIIARLEGQPRLIAALLYGCGLRITEALTLRLKDIQLADAMLTVRGGKGDKDRAVRLPQALIPELAQHMERCRRQWARDQAAGLVCPDPRPSLMRKFGRKTFGTLPWYWLFPSRAIRGDERWHATNQALNKALKIVAADLGIFQRVHPHALRHSYATSLLRTGTDIRTIQQQLGHSDVKTTEIYCNATGARGVDSPLDRPRAEIQTIPFPQPHTRTAASA